MMDHHAHVLNDGIASHKKSSSSAHFIPIEVLLIGREQTSRLYTDEVLRHAGFGVRSIAPWEADQVPSSDIQAYSLVVFSNTLNSGDISEIALSLRRRNPHLKLLLLLGPDSMPINLPMFDATLEGLEGPAALVRTVRKLAGSAGMNGQASMSA